MSVFKKERVHPMAIKCNKGHALVKWVDQVCPAEHVHQMACCPMRIGDRRCGYTVVIPQRTAECDMPPQSQEGRAAYGHGL